MELRCFIALELPQLIKYKIAQEIKALISSGADCKWVAPDNLHLTLKFLGSVPEGNIPDISGAIRSVCSKHATFRAKVKSTGVFPSVNRPRVVWIGLEAPDILSAIQSEIDFSLKLLGFKPEDRAFKPHITLGRMRSLKGKDKMLKELNSLSDMEFGEFDASFISLMKSDLRPSCAVYSTIARLQFS